MDAAAEVSTTVGAGADPSLPIVGFAGVEAAVDAAGAEDDGAASEDRVGDGLEVPPAFAADAADEDDVDDDFADESAGACDEEVDDDELLSVDAKVRAKLSPESAAWARPP